MSKEIKDAADLFVAEGEEAREILEGLKEQAKDALGLVISEAPAEGDFLGRYRHFKERELPLIMRLEDPGERRAVLEDIAKTHDLKVSDLRKALSAAEKRAEEAAAQENHEDGAHNMKPSPLSPEPSATRVPFTSSNAPISSRRLPRPCSASGTSESPRASGSPS